MKEKETKNNFFVCCTSLLLFKLDWKLWNNTCWLTSSYWLKMRLHKIIECEHNIFFFGWVFFPLFLFFYLNFICSLFAFYFFANKNSIDVSIPEVNMWPLNGVNIFCINYYRLYFGRRQSTTNGRNYWKCKQALNQKLNDINCFRRATKMSWRSFAYRTIFFFFLSVPFAEKWENGEQ